MQNVDAILENTNRTWPSDRGLGCLAARKLISNGLPRPAFDLIREGLRQLPDDPELGYLSALALSRGKNALAAERTASRLLERADLPGPVRADTLSLLGRLLKERCRSAKGDARRTLALQSADAYERAIQVHRNPFSGINAATMLRVAGNLERSEAIARDVLEQIDADRKTAGNADDYWTLATLGEAHLLLGHLDQARSFYASAVRMADQNVGDIASMRQQVLLLQHDLPPAAELQDEFSTGTVVVFTGHLVDRSDREALGLPSRFPADPAFEAYVREQIRYKLHAWDCRIGFSSAACGSDILFAEEALARGMKLHITLPFSRDDFYLTSVDFDDPAMLHWRQRCDEVLAKATEVSFATRERYLGDDHLNQFANQVLQGRAITQAMELNTAPMALAVIRRDVPLIGGTNEFVES